MTGSEDHLYVNFFGIESKAAMLACDKHGVEPEELLFISKKEFKYRSTDTDEAVLVRFTLHERQRQAKLRKLLGEKNSIILSGKTNEMWKQRKEITPNAPKIPKLSKKQIQKAAEAFDTSSDDDETIDERGMVRPSIIVLPQPESSEFSPSGPPEPNGEVSQVPPLADQSPDLDPTPETCAAGVISHPPPPESELYSSSPHPAGEEEKRSNENQTGVPASIDSPHAGSLLALQNTVAHISTQEPPPFTEENKSSPLELHRFCMGARESEQPIPPSSSAISAPFQNMSDLRLTPKPVAMPPIAPKSPPIPALGKCPRTSQTLAQEQKELVKTKKKIAKYSLKAPLEAKAYLEYMVQKKREERSQLAHEKKKRGDSSSRKDCMEEFSDKEFVDDSEGKQIEESSPASPPSATELTKPQTTEDSTAALSLSGSPKSLLNEVSKSASSGKPPLTPAPPRVKEVNKPPTVKDPHLRQIEATKRVAILKAQLDEKCFMKGWKNMQEEVPTQGTISHSLRFHEMVGKPPAFEQYKEKLNLNQKLEEKQREKRDKLNELDQQLTSKLLNGCLLAKEEQEKAQLIRKEVNRTKEKLREKKLRWVEKSCSNHRLHQESKINARHHRADTFNNEKYGDMALRRRYEHDQEELFRRQVQKEIEEMEHRKRWEIEKIRKLTTKE